MAAYIRSHTVVARPLEDAMATRITLAELTEHLPEIIERVHERKESFLVEDNGTPLLTVAPPAVEPSRTWKEFVERLADVPRPDDKFADDLEVVQAELNRLPHQEPEWLS
jgi:hypothetical protein